MGKSQQRNCIGNPLTTAAAAQFSRAKFQQQNWAGRRASQRRKSRTRSDSLGCESQAHGRAMLGCSCSIRNASAKHPNICHKSPPPLGNYSLPPQHPSPINPRVPHHRPPLPHSLAPSPSSSRARTPNGTRSSSPTHAFRFSPRSVLASSLPASPRNIEAHSSVSLTRAIRGRCGAHS